MATYYISSWVNRCTLGRYPFHAKFHHSFILPSPPRSESKHSLKALSVLFSSGLLATLLSSHIQAAQIALVIDDMGNKSSDAIAFQLPEEVVFSILPHTPYSKKFALRSAHHNREVMLHMPMEALSGLYMGPGGISSDMSSDTIALNLANAHQSVPNAIGINNHMGSKLTQLTLPMQVTMEFVTDQKLFFLDSRTTKFSKALKIAKHYGVPAAGRHVFLDHFRETSHIDYQFRRLIRKAKRNGFAIGIAHPHDVTINYLIVALEALKQEGIELVPLGEKLQPATEQWVWNQPGQLSR